MMTQSQLNFRRNRPLLQNFLAGSILFGTVGIYVAIANLGAGAGKANSLEMNYIVSSTTYGIFAVSGFFAGSIINRFGPRYAVMVGSVWQVDELSEIDQVGLISSRLGHLDIQSM